MVVKFRRVCQVRCDRCGIYGPEAHTPAQAEAAVGAALWWKRGDDDLCAACAGAVEEEQQAQDYHDELTHALRVEAGVG